MDQAPDPTMNPTSPTPPPAPAPMPEAAKKGPAYGSLIGIIVIVGILVAGAFYVWNERLGMNTVPMDGVRGGEPLPDGTYPTVQGSADIEAGPNGPMPQ